MNIGFRNDLIYRWVFQYLILTIHVEECSCPV